MKLLLLIFLAVDVVLLIWWYFGIMRTSNNSNSGALASYSLMLGGAFVLTIEAVILLVLGLTHWFESMGTVHNFL